MSLSPPAVFVIDDYRGTREALQWLIESAGVRALTYDHPARFLDDRDRPRSGCAVVELMLPRGAGVEFLRTVQAQMPPLPVIALTGYPEEAAMRAAWRLGAFAVLEKPFPAGLFIRHVRRALAVAGCLSLAAHGDAAQLLCGRRATTSRRKMPAGGATAHAASHYLFDSHGGRV
jgi:FixJ family two-component response regulator